MNGAYISAELDSFQLELAADRFPARWGIFWCVFKLARLGWGRGQGGWERNKRYGFVFLVCSLSCN